MLDTGSGKRIISIFFIFLFLLANVSIFIPTSVKAGFSIWPGKLNIGMPDGYPEEEIQYKIRVTNNNPYDLNVSSKIQDPVLEDITENYSFIPDLSWVKVMPETLCVLANDHQYFMVSIYIPDNEKPLHYNERWDVRVIISEKSPPVEGGVGINIELATKILISTPSGEEKWQSQYLLVGIFLIMVLVPIVLVFIKIKSNKKQ